MIMNKLKRKFKVESNFTLEECECSRCNEQKHVNKFGVCKECDTVIDKEYAELYAIKTMEY